MDLTNVLKSVVENFKILVDFKSELCKFLKDDFVDGVGEGDSEGECGNCARK